MRRARARGGGISRPLPTLPSVPLGGRGGSSGGAGLGRGSSFSSASAPLSPGHGEHSRSEPGSPPEPPAPRGGSRGGAGAGGEARRDVGRLRGLRGSAPALAPRSRCGRGRGSSRLAPLTLVTRDQAGLSHRISCLSYCLGNFPSPIQLRAKRQKKKAQAISFNVTAAGKQSPASSS